MWKAAFRSLFERKLRLALTTLSIVLGVGFISGTYILTDSIQKGFEEIFDRVTAGFDVSVRVKPLLPGTDAAPMSEAVLDEVRAIPGVGAADGSIQGSAQLLDREGKVIGGQGPPTLLLSYSRLDRLNVFAVREGRFPTGAEEVAIDASTAAKYGFEPGEKVRAILDGPVMEFTLTGTLSIEGLEDLGGATMFVLDRLAAQRLLDKEGKIDSIEVAAVNGVSQRELRNRIASKLEDGYEVIERDALVDRIASEIRTAMAVLTNALLPFGLITLFVGGFLIFNTFSIIFAQRVREFAMLRAIGAGRGQILRTVLAEAGVIGATASTIGVGAGVGMVSGLRGLLTGFGVDLPSSGAPLRPRTVAVAAGVGILVTLGASFFPALRATRIPPVTALREGAVLPATRFSRRRNSIAGVLGVLGAGVLLLGMLGGGKWLHGTQVLAVILAGAFMLFLSVALLSPVLVRPLARVVGWPVAKGMGISGQIARGNAMRDPVRTAATAAALMIGVALVTFVTMFASSSRATAARNLEERLRADFVVRFAPGSGTLLSTEIAPRLRDLPQVQEASGVRLGPFLLEDSLRGALGVEPSRITKLFEFEAAGSRVEDLRPGEVLVHEDLAEEMGWEQGTFVSARFARGDPEALRVAGTFSQGTGFRRAGSGGSFGVDVLMPLQVFEERFVEQRDWAVYLNLAPGLAPMSGRAAVEEVLEEFPNASVFDQADLRKRQEEQLNQLLGLVSALLALALSIAVLGIVNTLALSVLERVREIGLLRAIGTSRRQVRALIRWESAIIAVIGALLGIAVGTFFFGLVTAQERIQGEEGLPLVVPAGRLGLYVAVAALAGILAAVLPARRAARTDILRAIKFE